MTAFQNRQLWPLAASLGDDVGKDSVCLWASKRVFNDVPDWVKASATVVDSVKAIPQDVPVVLTTTHMLGMTRQHVRNHFGPAFHGDHRFDVLFVDEAWQLPHHLFDKITYTAPIHVGVGDVGQLPPLEIAENPWRGDPGFNPYRAWPTAYEGDDTNTWATELPAVWRPTGEQLGLWRAFYPEWDSLNCVAAPGDRASRVGQPVRHGEGRSGSRSRPASPRSLEVDGLPDAEAADVDLPLVEFVESPPRRPVRGRLHPVASRSTTTTARRAARRTSTGPARTRQPARRHPRDAQPGGRRRRRRRRPPDARSTA